MSKQGKQQRSFKVKLNTEEKAHGRYTGDSPYQAANKALSEIIRQRKTYFEEKTYFRFF